MRVLTGNYVRMFAHALLDDCTWNTAAGAPADPPDFDRIVSIEIQDVDDGQRYRVTIAT